MKDLISIVVPVYNVDYLLEKCVKSIINQTYKQLQIILVDDGSTDESGKLCDYFAKLDNRINVLHKKNGGLSSARNAGTEIASGKYLLYVDSDDWIALEMVSKLYEQIISTNADICACGISPTDGKEIKFLNWFKVNAVFAQEDALDNLIKGDLFTSHAWNKLYKTEIIKKYPFPEGKLYEDIYIMHNVFKACNTIAVVSDYFYYYYQRPNSITTAHNLKNRLAYVEAFKSRYQDVKTNSLYQKAVKAQVAVVEALVIVQSTISKDDKENFSKELKQIKLDLKQVQNKVVHDFSSRKQYVYFIAAKYAPELARLLYRIIEPWTNSAKTWKCGE